jgi:hypothetical protein
MMGIFEMLLEGSTERVEVKVFLNKTSIVILRSTTFEHNGQCLLVCILWKLNSGTDISEYNKLEVEVIMPVAVFHVLSIDL